MASTALLKIGVMFALIALAGWAARRVGQSVIPFYILAGMVAGPHVVGRVSLPGLGGLPHIEEMEFIYLAAEVGIVLLLFFLGLKFSFQKLVDQRRQIFRAGSLDLLVNFPLGFGVGYWFFGGWLEAFFVAGIVYISSSAIITKALIDLGWIVNPESEPMLGTLLYEDLVIAVYLALAAALIGGDGGITGLAWDVGLGMGFLLALFLFAYFGTAFFQSLLEVESREATVLRAVGITLLLAGAALAVGVSEAVAALFIGMAFSNTEHVPELDSLLSPVRDVFAAIFFFWIGLVTDPLLFGGVLGILVASVVFTSGSKLFTGYLSGKIYGLDTIRSLRVATGMVTRGEFSLIIATIAAGGATAVLQDVIPAFAVAYVVVMSILGSVLMSQTDGIAGWLRTMRPKMAETGEASDGNGGNA